MNRKRLLLTPALILGAVIAGAAPAAAITGGADVADGALPFVAKLTIGDTERACSGALVNPQLVLTAEACFAGADGNARSGVPTLATTVTVGRSNLDGTGGAVVPVRDIVVHPDRDLVLARLDTPVTSIAPVKIATAAPEAGEALTIVGFGRTENGWITPRMKSAPSSVDTVGDGTFDLIPAGDATSGVCKGDAGGPALRGSGGTIELAGVHHTANQGGCLGETTEPARATETRVDDLGSWITANLPGFRTGFESGDPRLNWHHTVGTETGEGGLLNVVGVCCGLTGPELFTGVPPEGAHGGTQAVLYSGKDNNATRSYAYTKAFGVRNLQVRPGTVLSYWIFPQGPATSFGYATGTNSTCVSVDLAFTDGSALRDSGAVDQRGSGVHPGAQCDKVPTDAWSQVIVKIGDYVPGKTIKTISIGYDQSPNTGGYRGFVDDIAITDVVRTDRFSTSLETGQPGLGWKDTVSATAPGGGLLNVGGVCCGLTGPEMFVADDSRAHTGGKIVLYSGKDNNATRSHAYTKAFGPTGLFVTPTSKLTYWIYPQSKENSFNFADGNNSACVAMDLILFDPLDGTSKSLRDSGATNQNGQGVHPGNQCTRLTLDQWNYISIGLGGVANGKQITQMDIGYDQPANTGGYRGFVDDVRITD